MSADGAVQEAAETAMETVTEHPVAATILVVGTACILTVMGACKAFGLKVDWNFGPWSFNVGKDRD